MKRALDGEENGDEITGVIGEGRGGHQEAKLREALAGKENRAQKERIKVVGKIGELKEIVEHGRRETLEPDCGVDAEKGVVEGDENGIEPSSVEKVNESTELFEENQEQQKRRRMTDEAEQG